MASELHPRIEALNGIFRERLTSHEERPTLRTRLVEIIHVRLISKEQVSERT